MAKPAQPIVDVAHPGKSLPSDSSRSIIVSNRPIIQDPDVKDSEPQTDSVVGAPLLDLAANEHQETELTPSQKKITIDPPNHDKEEVGEPITVTVKAPQAADSIPEPTTVATETPKADKPVAEPVKKAEPTTAKPAKEATQPAAAAAPVKESAEDTPADDDEAPDTLPQKDEKQLAADAAQAAKVEGLIKRQVYVLPINAVERRRSKHVVVGGLVLIVLLAFAWLDLAADAGFIHVPYLPLTHFFRV